MNSKINNPFIPLWDRVGLLSGQLDRSRRAIVAGREPSFPVSDIMSGMSPVIDPVDATVKDKISYNTTPTAVEKVINIFKVPAYKRMKISRIGIMILDQVALSDQVNYLNYFEWRLRIGTNVAPYFNPTSLSWTNGVVWADLAYDANQNDQISIYVNEKPVPGGGPTGDLNIAVRLAGQLTNYQITRRA